MTGNSLKESAEKTTAVPSRSRLLQYAIRRQGFFLQQRFFYALSFFLLDNKTSSYLRCTLLRASGAVIGADTFIRGSLQIQEGFRGLRIGTQVFINAGCCFDLSAPIVIGDRVQFAYQVTLITGGHEIGPPECRAGAHKPGPIHIGDGAWVGARAVILPGVTVGTGAVIAAGSLVTKDVAANTLVGGVPAKLIRELSSSTRDDMKNR